MRTLAVLPIIGLLGCAHHQAQTKTQASSAPPAEPAPPKVAALNEAPKEAASDPASCTSVRVHFELDRSDIDAADRDGLERAAGCLRADRALHIAIEGNADERGTEEYNLALGERRAQSVATYLRSLGASEQQLRTVSYGKERPLCSEHDEACWAQNRRADLVAQSTAANTKKPRRR
jgi:peptidoglycan-associated lipoprotein